MPCEKIDEVNNQPIYQINEDVFLKCFTNIVKKKNKLNLFKKNSSLFINDLIKNFNYEINKIINA